MVDNNTINKKDLIKMRSKMWAEDKKLWRKIIGEEDKQPKKPLQAKKKTNIISSIYSRGLITRNVTLTITNIGGQFANNVLAIGTSSGARYTVTNSDNFEHPPLEPYDNKTIINQVSGIIDTSENNPIGGL